MLMDEKDLKIIKCFDKGIMDLKIYRDLIISCNSDGGLIYSHNETLETIDDFDVNNSCASYISINKDACYISYLDGSV